MTVLGPGEKLLRPGEVAIRVIFDEKTGRFRPITKAEAAKADAKMKPLLDFVASLPK